MKWHDDYLGMIDYGRRWYYPRMGRWINRDPIGEEGGENLYGFCGNCPINSVDQFGLSIQHRVNLLEDGWVHFITMPIQIVDFAIDHPRLSDSKIQQVINDTWSREKGYRVWVEKFPLPNVSRSEEETGTVRIVMDAQVTTVSCEEINENNHTFYLVNKASTINGSGQRVTSHAGQGGMNSEIFLNHRNLAGSFAHETGHWLGLLDTYAYPAFLPVNRSADTEQRTIPGYENNTMSVVGGTDLELWQYQHIYDFVVSGLTHDNPCMFHLP